MKRFVLAGLIAFIVPGAGFADVCTEGGQLRYPNYAVAGQLGLSVIVEARRHPARADRVGMTVSERVAALEQAFADDFGHEPGAVQDLRRLATFVEVFWLARGTEPSVTVILSEPEYVVALLPTLRAYQIDSAVAVLEAVEDAFWQFEDSTTRALFDQFFWGSFIGVTFSEVRETAPAQLALARTEVEAAITHLIASDSSVAAVMQVLRERVSDSTRLSFMVRSLEQCAGFYGGSSGSSPPDNWEALPQTHRTLLTLDRLRKNDFGLPDLFASDGWMLEEALDATNEAGLVLYWEALYEGLGLFPHDMDRTGAAWQDAVWAREGRLTDIRNDLLYNVLRAEQDPQYEVSYSQAIREGMFIYARDVGLWPHD